MKRIPHPLRVTVIILCGLLLSTVLAQTGGYNISAWVVADGGGGSAGGDYSLDGTIGQPVAGHISGGSYTLDSGYWALDDTISGAKIYLPAIERGITPTPTSTPTQTPTPTSTPEIKPKCDGFEPNDERDNNPARIIVGVSNTAKFCKGDIEDNYFFTSTLSNHQFLITIILPDHLVSHVVLRMYDRQQVQLSQEICIKSDPVLNKVDNQRLCVLPHPGDYIVRMYTHPDDGSFYDDTHVYTVQVDP